MQHKKVANSSDQKEKQQKVNGLTENVTNAGQRHCAKVIMELMAKKHAHRILNSVLIVGRK